MARVKSHTPSQMHRKQPDCEVAVWARLSVGLLVLVATCGASPTTCAGDEDRASDMVRRAEVQIGDPSLDHRRRAVEVLRTRVGESATPGLRLKLANERLTEPARDAICAVLAARGDRAAFSWLIQRLSACGDDEATSIEQWLSFAARDKPCGAVDDDWDNDTSLVHPGGFPSGRQSVALRWWRWLAVRSDSELASSVAGQGPGARFGVITQSVDVEEFRKAALVLQIDGDREAAAHLFHLVAEFHSTSPLAAEARELSVLLVQMDSEDKLRKARQKSSSRKLGGESMEELVYRLRDVVRVQVVVPSRLCLACGGMEGDPIDELCKIGSPVATRMIGLLTDRRPIRAVAEVHRSTKAPVVLRYQDAAIEILSKVIPFRPSTSATEGTYFSMLPEASRLIARDRAGAWIRQSVGLDALGREWLAARLAPVPDRLDILARAGMDGARRAGVIDALRAMFRDEALRYWRPEVCEVMCGLGDDSLLSSVIEEFGDWPEAPRDLCEVRRVADVDDEARYFHVTETLKRIRRDMRCSGQSTPHGEQEPSGR